MHQQLNLFQTKSAPKTENISCHPFAYMIESLTREKLINRMRYTEIAIDYWSSNKENAPRKEVDKNLKYFKTELELIKESLKEQTS